MENLNKYMSYIYIYIQKYYRPFKKQLKLCLNLSLMITILPINVFIVGRLAKTAMNTSTIISHVLQHVTRVKLNYILLNIHRKMDFFLSNAVALWSPLMVHLNTKENYITSLQSQNITCSIIAVIAVSNFISNRPISPGGFCLKTLSSQVGNTIYRVPIFKLDFSHEGVIFL